jgi:hypothetical protein
VAVAADESDGKLNGLEGFGMKRSIVLALACVLVLGVVATAGWWFHERAVWEDAYTAAIQAFRGAYESRDEDTAAFAPERREFEIQRARLDDLLPRTDEEVDQAEKLRLCADDLDLYRESSGTLLESVTLRSESPEEFAKDRANLADLSKGAFSCLRVSD